MAQWIEVTNEFNVRLIVNLDLVEFIRSGGDGSVFCNGREAFTVKESYEELRQTINPAIGG
jgi:hypothetical protein